MYRSVRARALGLLSVLLLVSAGCFFGWPAEEDSTATADNNSASWPLQVLSERPPQTPVDQRYTETEPNNTLENAEVVLNGDYVELNGNIPAGSETTDMDIYRLQGAAVGDGLQASMILRAGNGVVMAILDDRQRILAYADPSSLINGPRIVDLSLHEATSELIVVVAARSASTIDRPYTARLEMRWGAGVLGYQPQVVVLNFDGGDSVKIGLRNPVYVPPFDAATIDGRLAGKTATLRDLIVQQVREDYAGLGIEIYGSGDPNIPNVPVTTVHFGTYDAALLGLADSIDPYNTLPEQNAIIFTDTFRLFNVLFPSINEYAQVLANVASHESGHLLGLRHTEDVHDLMDITASARQMLSDQWFRTAVLHPTVLPTGVQDSPTLLAWALGGVLVSPPTGKIVQLERAAATVDDPNDFYIPREWLGICAGGTDDSIEAAPADSSSDPS